MNKKQIFVYDSVASPNGQRGVNRYFLKFLESLGETYAERVLVYSQRELDIDHVRQIRPYASRRYLQHSSRIRKAAKIFDRYFVEHIANSRANLFYSPYFGFVKTKIPQAYTLPDMIYEKFPQYFDHGDVNHQSFMAEKRACFERAALILPISMSAANDLQEIYPHLPSERIKVVYLGVDDVFFESHVISNDSRPYFLFVGNRDRYKNFLRFVDAFGRLGLQKEFDLRIISPVQNEFTANEKAVIERYRLGSCVHVEHAVSDAVLKKRYAEAYAFVYPTEYEGFGFPVVEALASGAIVLTSNRSSLPEVGGSAPLYFDPTSTDAMVNALEAASRMSDTDRQQRITTGRNWARQFTWENSQRSFLAAVQEFLNEHLI